MEQHIGIEEARKTLGDLVTAAMYGHTTTITRNGTPAARLVPIEEFDMHDNLVTITFPESDVDAAVARYERLVAVAEDLGRAGATWKVTEGWFNIHLASQTAADRLQVEAVPLPSGWTMHIGPRRS